MISALASSILSSIATQQKSRLLLSTSFVEIETVECQFSYGRENNRMRAHIIQTMKVQYLCYSYVRISYNTGFRHTSHNMHKCTYYCALHIIQERGYIEGDLYV
jgi:hypothetical protein